MFEPSNEEGSKRRKDVSADLWLAGAFHLAMITLWLSGGYFTIAQELGIALLALATVVALAIAYRLVHNWRWPGIRRRDVINSLGGLSLLGVFLYACSPLFPPSDHRIFPWYLAACGLGLFGVLQQLHLACSSRTEFLAQCRSIDLKGRPVGRTPAPARLVEVEPSWKMTAKRAFAILFFLVAACLIGEFYCFGISFRDGSPQPSQVRTEPLENHGQKVYIRPAEKERIELLQDAYIIGMIWLLVGGFTLQFAVGVQIFDNLPTVTPYRRG